MYESIGKLANNKKTGILVRLIRLLPSRLAYFAAAGTGLLLLIVQPRLRRIIAGNMEEVLTECSRKEIRGFVRKYFINLAVTLYQLVLDVSRLPEQGEKLIRLEGEAHLRRALSNGRGAILYAPHVGNFFYYYWKLSQRLPCLAVATAGSPELRPIYMNFQRMGCKGLDYDDTPPVELIRRLRSHLEEGGAVFILGDFYRPSFPETQLLGRRTRGPAGAAMLALERQAPVVPCFGYREHGFRHVIELGEPVHLHELFTRHERTEAMLHLNDILSRQICTKPEQWFYWFEAHKRWKGNGSDRMEEQAAVDVKCRHTSGELADFPGGSGTL